MPTIRKEDYRYFENKIYLPMLIKILEKDLELFNKLPFKLNRPYLKIVEDTLKLIRKDLKTTEIFLTRNHMKAFKWESDEKSTTYVFSSAGVEEHTKMLNVEIKEKCEELLLKYFTYE